MVNLNPLSGYHNKVNFFDALLRNKFAEEERIKAELADPSSYSDYELIDDFESTLYDGLEDE